MSSTLHIYVGPYFQSSRVTRDVEQSVRARCSSDANHSISPSGAFCPVCASIVLPAAKQTVSVERFVGAHEHGDDRFVDEMMSDSPGRDEAGRWLPNSTAFGKTFSNHRALAGMDLSPEIIDVDVARMAKHYEEFVSHMVEKFGVQVTPKFGVIPYWM